MSMAIDVQPTTRTAVLALPIDAQRHELIAGRYLVTPAPRMAHQEIVRRLNRQLDRFVEQHALGRLFCTTADLAFGEDEVLQPDLFLVPADCGATHYDAITSLTLVIEVLSPGTASIDRGLKRDRYQRAPVAEYWIVDPISRMIERWRPEDVRPEICREVLQWMPPGASTPFILDVAALFADVE